MLPGSSGLTYRIPDEQRTVYQRAFVNLPFVNGDDSWELPIPATYIIDRDGSVLDASANEDYTERPEPDGDRAHPGQYIRTLEARGRGRPRHTSAFGTLNTS